MSIKLNTNLHSLRIMGEMDRLGDDIQTNLTRLSTGLRINSGADDPAGLAISEILRKQIYGTTTAIDNTQNGINMIRTAEAALNEVHTLIHKIRTLSVHAANTAVVDADQLNADQSEIRNCIASINRIAGTTAYGTKNLLDGTAGNASNITSPNNINLLKINGSFNGAAVNNGTVTMQVTTPATKAGLTLTNGFTNAGTIVNTVGNFSINGYTFTSSGTDTIKTLVDKINMASNTTKVTAQLTGTSPVTVSLSALDYGSQYNINLTDGSGILNAGTVTTSTGVNGVVVITAPTSLGNVPITLTGGQGLGDSGLYFSDNDGNAYQITQAFNATTTPTAVGQISSGSVRFQIGPNANQGSTYSMPNVFANQLGAGAIPNQNLTNIDVRTPAGSQNAMAIADMALKQLSQIRGDLGAYQANFLESTKRTLAVQRQSMEAAESTIRDADIAAEMSKRTMYMIRQKAAMAVLAQANNEPANALSLISG